MREQFTKQLGKIGVGERDTDFLDSLSLGWSEQGLDFGDEIHSKTLGEMVKTYPDYTENQEQYDAFAKSKEDSPRYDNVFKQDFFKLDNENNLQYSKGWYGKFGEGDWGNPKNLYDQNVVKGMLLAKRNGYTLEGYDSEYNRVGNELATSYQQQMSEQSKTSEKIGHALGMMGRYIATPETIIEVASPFKVKTGKTIAQSMYYSAKAELPYAFVGEAIRQKGIMAQKRRVSQEYTLWDATKEVLINAGFASGLRAIGGGVVDGVTHAKVSKKIKNGKDKETWDRFVDMQNSQLVPNAKLHNELINKTEDDIEMGRDVDVAELTEIDALAKADEGVEEINIYDELPKESPEVEQALIKEVDEIQPIKESDNPYEGMTTPEEADKLINDFIDNPEIAQELEEIRLMEETIKSQRADTTQKPSTMGTSKQQQMKEASTGGTSEDEMKQAVNNIMSEKDLDSQFKNMSKADMDELDSEFIREEAEQLWAEAEADAVFAKGGDNIASGLVAGIEQDENGNISLDPVKFIMGMGGYTAVKAMAKSPKVRQELKDFAQKAIEKVEGNPMFDARAKLFAGGRAKGFHDNYDIGKNFSDIADKQERFWIDDIDAEFIQKPLYEAYQQEYKKFAYLDEVLKHDKLFEEYPGLKDLKIEYSKMDGASFDGNIIKISDSVSLEESKSMILHEVQHAIQKIEGFAKGGSYKDFTEEDLIREIFKEYKHLPYVKKLVKGVKERELSHKEYKDKILAIADAAEDGGLRGLAHELYTRLAGEQEARAVQAKLKHPELSPYEALKKEEGIIKAPIVRGVN